MNAHIRSEAPAGEDSLWESSSSSLPVCLQAVLQVCDPTGSVSVVLWNSVCVDWYRCLKPGDIISLRRYRVKRHYQVEEEDIGAHTHMHTPVGPGFWTTTINGSGVFQVRMCS